jgi:hypothetical protein
MHFDIFNSGANGKTYVALVMSYGELKIYYDYKSSIERMTKVYLPSKEELVAAHPNLMMV